MTGDYLKIKLNMNLTFSLALNETVTPKCPEKFKSADKGDRNIKTKIVSYSDVETNRAEAA